ncbi:hypothetical protein [Bifidobacterium cuniculi]|uniref:Phage protein n=1 Tax=Bifidobacterium cuniculi TaxID=1688 RepID=A0A087B4D2_9BIFI|nr:hypothetical protein [Bifidobacterium cuniculi]KFI65882.1 hypothetical protein BCUN_0378 [Bifidobacterium cuniculi]
MDMWVEILIGMCGSGAIGGALTALTQHLIREWNRRHHPENDPDIKARNVLSRHAGLRILKDLHHDAIQRGYISLDELDEAHEVYAAYHQLGGNGAGTRIIHDLERMNNYPTIQK